MQLKREGGNPQRTSQIGRKTAYFGGFKAFCSLESAYLFEFRIERVLSELMLKIEFTFELRIA